MLKGYKNALNTELVSKQQIETMTVNQYNGLKQTQKLSCQITRHGRGDKLTADKEKHRHKITGHRCEQSGRERQEKTAT